MTVASLGEIADFVRGITFKPTDTCEDGVGVMRTKNVQRTLDLSDIVRVPVTFVRREEQYLQKGDTLVSSANSWAAVGKACWVPELSEQLAIGGFVTALRPRQRRVDARYLYLWFTSPPTQALMRSYSNATTSISNLNLDRARALAVPLPSIEEQRRIAAILDYSDVVRAARLRSLSSLDDLRHMIFHEMFGNPMQPGRNGMRKLGELSRIVRGASPRPAGDPRYFGGPIPWLKISDLTAEPGAVIRRIENGVTDAGQARSVTLPGDTLVVSNSATVGIAKIVEPSTCIHDGFLAFLDLHPDVDQYWLYHALSVSRKILVGLAPEGTQKNLNTPIVKAIQIQVPPRKQQQCFLIRAGLIDAQLSRIQHALSLDDELFASLQTRAFRGEL